eukprot:gene7403-8223_t
MPTMSFNRLPETSRSRRSDIACKMSDNCSSTPSWKNWTAETLLEQAHEHKINSVAYLELPQELPYSKNKKYLKVLCNMQIHKDMHVPQQFFAGCGWKLICWLLPTTVELRLVRHD